MRRARLSFGLCAWSAAALVAAQLAASATARAQEPGGDELIADPELTTGTVADARPTTEDELIADPELGGSSSSYGATRAEPNGEVRLELHTRAGVDTEWQDPREDVFELTQIALLEARVRRSEDVLFVLGVRARYWFATRERDTPDASAGHYLLDAVPTAGYVDVTAADGLHVRAGYQSVRLGRFEVLDPTDILSVYDFRSGPTTLAGASEIAQPALTIDWDIGSWFGMRAIVLPFFEPHLVHVSEGDYALSPARQAEIDDAFAPMEPGEEDPMLAANGRRLQRLLRRTLTRSGQAQLNDATLSAFAPEPSFTRPQAALRLTAHAPLGEISLTAGVARERLPTPSYDRAYLEYTQPQMGGPSRPQIDAFLLSTPITMHYDPFAIVSIDAATALGPFQLGVELAYMWHRTFLAAYTAEVVTPADAADALDHSDLAHAGARIEYAPNTDFVFTIEVSAERAMQTPSDPNRSFQFLSDGRWLLSAAGFVAAQPFDVGLTLELGAGLLSGPTYMLAPRAEQRITDGLYVEAGAYFLGGAHRPLGDPRATLGGIYDWVDQVFVGLRWVP